MTPFSPTPSLSVPCWLCLQHVFSIQPLLTSSTATPLTQVPPPSPCPLTIPPTITLNPLLSTLDPAARAIHWKLNSDHVTSLCRKSQWLLRVEVSTMASRPCGICAPSPLTSLTSSQLVLPCCLHATPQTCQVRSYHRMCVYGSFCLECRTPRYHLAHSFASLCLHPNVTFLVRPSLVTQFKTAAPAPLTTLAPPSLCHCSPHHLLELPHFITYSHVYLLFSPSVSILAP